MPCGTCSRVCCVMVWHSLPPSCTPLLQMLCDACCVRMLGRCPCLVKKGAHATLVET